VTAPSARDAWNSAAPGWDAAFDWYAENLRPLSDWFCARVAVPGARVLDVACGTGLPALAIAARVGAAGRVLATDLALGMLTAVQRRGRQADLGNLEVREMDAQQLECDGASFDAVTCSCGLMLFPDPAAALAEMRRVLVPNGRLAVTVWAEPSDNPFFTIAAAAVNALFPPRDPDATPPKGFSMSAPGELERVLRAAALTDVAVERLGLMVKVASVDEYWRLYTSFVPGLGDRIAGLPAAEGARAREVLADRAALCWDGECFRLGATALCAHARKQG
jgi:SAM-dependent methyltransferase